MSDANAPQPADPAHDTLASLYGLGAPTPDPARDLRTLAEIERDDVAALRAELAELRSQQAAIVEAIQRHADALQAMLLRGDDGR